MKKSSISQILFVAWVAIFVGGCAAPAPVTSIPLGTGGEKITLEFQQDGAPLPVTGSGSRWSVTLKPGPFALVVDGNREIVSIMAVQSPDLILPLQRPSTTLLKIPGSGNQFSENDLYLVRQPLEIYDLDVYTLQNLSYFSFSSGKAAATLRTLNGQFGSGLLALFAPRSYLNVKQDQNYLVKTIGERPIQKGDASVLLVFAEQPTADPLFSALQWVAIDLRFE